jgi:hypothetical protein
MQETLTSAREGRVLGKKLNVINYVNNVFRAALLRKHIALVPLVVFHITKPPSTVSRKQKNQNKTKVK